MVHVQPRAVLVLELLPDGVALGGRNRIAGEFGHNPLPWPADDERPGPACFCGQRGCIETFGSGTGFARDHNAVYPELAAAHGVPLYPFFLDGVAGRRGLTLADGVHPNARAIEIVTRSILPHVIGALRISEPNAEAA